MRKEQKNSSKMSGCLDAFLRNKAINSHPVEPSILVLVEAAENGRGGGLDRDGRRRQVPYRHGGH